ncbi:type II toxin-antitoxin system RelE/ParE family toxin [Roseitranquillus sediminis]|uniref:type II toxin-antitoxin system RelE/ParE family toxin n=1 Tax=Roseitranquillus sediminis TaxID=2809051 RepID=UPI001D0BFD94|nr:type II toxin-antitoxin system RelE/ParE family toxin [Roseitranquillus sediminis]MBM9593995.1 type II toxin-antitoxin system RelE/ParE family toxin [Roseitranquillus sediminis]
MEAEPLRLELTPAARQDLEAIWDYSARTWFAAQAAHYLRGLQVLLRTLQAFPELARERTEFTPPVRLHAYRRHLVVYRIEADALIVLRILHARRNWQTLLAEPD